MEPSKLAKQVMNHKALDKNNQKEVADLFAAVFTASEGEHEGKLIGDLASKLSLGIDQHEIICFGAYEKTSIVGAIFFTRLQFNKERHIYMLAPVAVSTQHQGKGVGQALINFGLNALRNRSVTTVVTYGDPSFYVKVGFKPLSEHIIQAPLKLSMPEGWLGQSLTAAPIAVVAEHPTCVKAFNDPVYW